MFLYTIFSGSSDTFILKAIPNVSGTELDNVRVYNDFFKEHRDEF